MSDDHRFDERLDDTAVALAARAAGEDVPGGDAAELERLLRGDPALREESERLAHAVAVLRSAAVAPDAARRSAAVAGARVRAQSPRNALRWAAAAAVLLVAVGVALRLGLEPPPPEVAGIAARQSPFDDLFADAARRPQGDTAGPVPASGVSFRGSGAPDAGFLGPFAAQADFRMVAPEALPPGASLVAARFRRRSGAERPFSFAWFEWTTPEGPVVLVEAPVGGATGAGGDALERLPVPAGWRHARAESGDVAVVVASPAITDEQLEAVAGSVAPIVRAPGRR